MNPKQQSLDEFVSRYGGIYQHSPWVAEETHEFIELTNITTVDNLFRNDRFWPKAARQMLESSPK